MTLIIGTVSKNNVVLTADGLSRANPTTGEGMEGDNLQKIFPHGTFPLAIVHHGLNIVNRKSVNDRVADFYEHMGDRKFFTLWSFVKSFRAFVDDDAKETFNDPSNKGIIGFWLSGFAYGERRPELYEILWPDKLYPKNHGHLVLGGDAKRFINRYLHEPLRSYSPDKTNVRKYSPEEAASYHNALYDKAELQQKTSGESVFGGHKHQLVITQSECEWRTAPT